MPSVLVTGAGRGIGLAITRHLGAAGWDVYATARSDSALADLAHAGQVLHLNRQGPSRAVICGAKASWNNAGGVLGQATTGYVHESPQVGTKRFDQS